MKQLYYSDNIEKDVAYLSGQEFSHCIKVMRHRAGDRIELIDGCGGIYKCLITEVNKTEAVLDVIRVIHVLKKPYNLHIAISPTKNQDRMEWFVEKSVELGVSKISFVSTARSERKLIKLKRINTLIIGTIKQSNQYYLPVVDDITHINQFIENNKLNNILNVLL